MAMNVLAEVRRLWLEWHRASIFIATVDSISGGSIKVIRDGQSTAEPVFYAAANGLAAAVSAGHRVLVVDASGEGGYVVVCRVVT